MLFSINKIIRKNNFLKGIFLFMFFFFSIFNFQITTIKADTPWYNPNWGYRSKITIDHTKVQSTNQTDFPVLINKTDLNWKVTGSGGHVGQADGGDFVFTSSDGTTKLSHEIEKYTSTTGELVAWVKIPTLSASVDTDLYIYYGNASVADQWNITGTWNSNYKAVYHLPDGTSLSANDSTSNANNGTLSSTPPTAVAGQMDGGATFAGSPRYISLPVSLSVPMGAVNYVGTISFWAKSGSGYPISIYRTSDQQGGFAFLNLGTTFDYTNCDVLVNPYCHTISSATSFTSSNWNHFVFTSDGSGHYQLAVNGVVTPVTYSFSSIAGSYSRIMIAYLHNYSYGDAYYSGSLDDVRVSDNVRSADWITTEYNNQSSPSTFYSVSTEEPYVPNTVPDAPTGLIATAGNTQVSLSWSAPVNNGGTSITDYVIDYKLTTEPTVWSTFADGVSTSTSGTVTGLTNGLSYDFRVSAVNVVGQGSASSTATATPITVPGAPTSLIAVAENAQVSLSWVAPVFDGGTSITDYVIDYKLTTEPTVWSTFADGVSTSTSGTVTGLTNGLSYDFRVSAVNVVGQGSASSTATATPITVPEAPIMGTATAGNAEATVTFTPASTSWYNPNWGYRSKITIDHTKVQSTNQTDFPVLINKTDLNWKVTGSGGHVGQADGGDFVFTSSDGTTKLSHEIEKYTSTTGELVAWVKIPTLSASVDTDLYIYYGNASVADQWNITGTWNSNYKAVYHLADPTNPIDSTGAANGTNNGSTSTTGEIDGAATFNGTNQYISLPVSLYVPMGAVNYVGTISFWAKSGSGTPIAIYRTSSDSGGYAYFEMDATTLKYLNCDLLVFPYCHSIDSVTSFTSSNWNHFVFTSDGSGHYQLAVNGVVTPTTYSFAVVPGSYSRIMIAYVHNYTYNDSYYSGSLDDVRVSDVARSADWITTEYNNQSSPSTFYLVATEENVSSPAPLDGGSTITGYTATSNPGNITGTGSSSPIVVTGLTNGTSYTFTVTATNAVGTSASSSASNAVTPSTLPGAPTAFSATAGNTQVSLSWSTPASNGGSTITDYVIEYKLTTEPTVWSTFADGVSTSTSGTVTGLTNGLSYDFRVSAVNVVGQGSASSTATATPITIPGAPTSVVATRGNTQASVSFSAPVSNGGSAITNYTVTSIPESHIGTGSSSPIIVTGLTNGTSYTFTVTATNAAGTGPDSDPSNAVTPATTPDAPTSPSAVPGNGEATISFTPPVSDGGSAITGYTVTSSPGGLTGTGSSSPIVVTGLTNGTSYTFTVTATNDVGTGSASVSSNAVIPVTVPGAPTIGTATRGNTQATITFTPPVSDGGSAITGYTVTSSPGGLTGTGSSSPIVVTGLTNGTSYTFTVTATNAVGTSASSSASNAVTPATVPDPPTGLTPTAGNAQVSLSWTAPVDNGGSSITDYVIEYKLTSEPTVWSTFADGVSASTSGTVTGLTNGLSYDFRVSAVNEVGQGSTSVEATSTPVTVPGAPTIGTATRGNTQATITFTPPVSDGGSAITGYTVTSSPGGLTGTGSSSPIVVTGLTNGTSYTFTVTATNAVGTSASSSASNAVTPATVPDPPTSVSAVEGNTQATISFTPPVSDGGSTITGYTVTSSPGGLTGTGSSSPIIVTGLTNGTSYTFTVTATNDVGTGSASLPSNSVTLSTEPGAPVNLAATVLGSSIGLSWSAPVSNGGSAITDYIAEYQLSTGGVWSVFSDGTSTNTTTTVTGLSNGTSYDFRVSAVNIIGQSIPSGSVTASPGEPAQVLIQSFSDLTVQSIGTNIRITNEGSVQYEYQYTWCVTDAVDNLCGGGDDIFSASNAKLIQPAENWDTNLVSIVPSPGDFYFHIKVLYGSQSSSAYQSFTAVATFPDAPTIGTATRGNTQATITFTPPVSDGGSAITGYTVTSSPGGLTGTGNSSPIVVTGLTNGTSYTFTVTATNAVGTSASSSASNAVTPATVPDPPTGLTPTSGNAQVSLSWTAPVDNGGSAITDYVIEYKLTSEPTVWSTFADGVSTSTSGTVTGLTNGLSYDFRVSAVNEVGQSSINGASASPVNNTPPSSGGGGGVRPIRPLPQIPPTQIIPPQNESSPNPVVGTENGTKNTFQKPQSPTQISNPSVPSNTKSQNKNEVSATPKENTKLPIFELIKVGDFNYEIIVWAFSLSFIFLIIFYFVIRYRRRE